MQEENIKNTREIMKILGISRRKVEYYVESLGLEAVKQVSRVRFFSSSQIEKIREKAEKLQGK